MFNNLKITFHPLTILAIIMYNMIDTYMNVKYPF